MAKILRVNGVAGDGYAELDWAGSPDVYVTMDVRFPPSYISYVNANPLSSEILELDATPNSVDWLFLEAIGGGQAAIYVNSASASFGVLDADTWYTLEFHVDQTGAPPSTVDLWIDGVLLHNATPTLNVGDIDAVFMGLFFAATDADQQFDIDNVKVGTSQGGTDLLTADFEDGLIVPPFTAIQDSSGTGDSIFVFDEPTSTVPIGVSVVFDADGPLDTNATFTQLDAIDNLISSYTIQRGRRDNFERTSTGVASIGFNDQDGIVDPTAPGWLGEIIGCPVSLSLHNPVTDTWTVIFHGLGDDVTWDVDPTQQFNSGTISLVDGLDYLANTELIPDLDLSVFPSAETPAYAIPRKGFIYFPQTTGTVDDRINDVLTRPEVDWPSPTLRSIFTGNVRLLARSYSVGTTALTVIDDACDAEFPGIANRYISKETSEAGRATNLDAGTFVFHGRLARFDPTNPDYDILIWKAGDGFITSMDDTYAQIRGLTFGRARTDIVNAASFTYQGIADAEIPEMLVEDPTSITAFGRRSKSADNLVLKESVLTGNDAHDECILYGTYWTTTYSAAQTRVRQVVFRSMHPTDPRAASVWALMCGVEISDIIRLSVTLPGGGDLSDVDYFVEGITYQVSPLQPDFQNVTLTLDLTPRAYYDFEWVP